MKGTMDTARFSGGGLFFAGAALLALLAGFSVYLYLSAAAPSTAVLVVNRDLPPGASIAEADLEVRKVPAGAVPDRAVLEVKDGAGRRLRYGLVAGDILRENHLVAQQSSDIGRAVAEHGPEYRAVMVAGELVPALDRLLPGDKLELVGVLPVQDQKNNSSVAVPLGTAVVLEVHKARDQADRSVVLVAVTAQEVARLALTMRNGTLTVAIQGEGESPPAQPMRLEALTSVPALAAQPAAVLPAPDQAATTSTKPAQSAAAQPANPGSPGR